MSGCASVAALAARHNWLDPLGRPPGLCRFLRRCHRFVASVSLTAFFDGKGIDAEVRFVRVVVATSAVFSTVDQT